MKTVKQTSGYVRRAEDSGFSTGKGDLSTINSSHGLPNDVVYQIVDDNEGFLWLSTNAGLVRFDPEGRTFQNYTVNNGLKTNQFNYQSGYKTRDGIIYFGSLDGFVRFNPSSFKEAPPNAPIFLRTFLSTISA